jgi:hypothetical protein
VVTLLNNKPQYTPVVHLLCITKKRKLTLLTAKRLGDDHVSGVISIAVVQEPLLF